MTRDGIRLAETTAPTGFDVTGARWIEIDRPDGHSQIAAIFLPMGSGPFPTVVFLHGSSGLSAAQLQWAPRLAAAGYMVVAGCYLDADTSGAFMPCPGLPPNDPSDTTVTSVGYKALLSTAQALGAAKPGALGVDGVSLGATVALDSPNRAVTAIVADSGFGAAPVSGVIASVLLLGNTTDPKVSHTDLVAYEQQLRGAGKPVESHYYDNSGHVTITTPPNIDDATQRIVAFFDQHLR
jgi:dienelactone hydrolase